MVAAAKQLTEQNAVLATRAEERKISSDRHLAAARIDPLTEASNRLHLETELEGIADRVLRYGHRYCVAFCDVDTFKSYNDTFGHLAGFDAAMASFDTEATSSLRSYRSKRSLAPGNAWSV
jgi:diguanylate cyclase